MKNKTFQPIELPHSMAVLLATSTEEPVVFSWEFEGQFQPKTGDLLWLQEEFCAHWGRPCEGGVPRAGFAVEQSNGSFATATEEEPLYVYYKSDGRAIPLSHLKWLPAKDMPVWASRMTLEVTSDTSEVGGNRCVLKLQHQPIDELIKTLNEEYKSNINAEESSPRR